MTQTDQIHGHGMGIRLDADRAMEYLHEIENGRLKLVLDQDTELLESYAKERSKLLGAVAAWRLAAFAGLATTVMLLIWGRR